MATKDIKDIETVGTLLARTRDRRQLSKSAAAREMGVARMTYDMWEKDAWVPDPDKAKILADFAGVEQVEVLTILWKQSGVLDEDEYLAVKKRRS